MDTLFFAKGRLGADYTEVGNQGDKYIFTTKHTKGAKNDAVLRALYGFVKRYSAKRSHGLTCLTDGTAQQLKPFMPLHTRRAQFPQQE